MVELAIVLPAFVGILLFGAFLTDLACVRLELQEAARFAAWRMTSHPIEDWKDAEHERAFEKAAAKVLEEAKEHYELEPEEEEERELGAIVREPAFSISNAEVPIGPEEISLPIVGDLLSNVAKSVQEPAAAVMGLWGFDVKGGARAEVQVEVTAAGDLLEEPLMVKEQHALVASVWHIPDGSDATVTEDEHRAGSTPKGEVTDYWRQVDRLTLLGAKSLIGGVAETLRDVGTFLPVANPFGTYLISHGYSSARVDGRAQGDSIEHCNVDPGRGGGTSGMHNLATKKGGHPKLLGGVLFPDTSMRCFDTAPFRDRHAYDKSPHRAAFLARGPWFMGCRNAQADDPTGESGVGGQHSKPIACVEGR